MQNLLKFRAELRYATTLIQRLSEQLENGPAAEHMRKAEANMLMAKQILGCKEDSALAIILKPFKKPRVTKKSRKRKPVVIRHSASRNHL